MCRPRQLQCAGSAPSAPPRRGTRPTPPETTRPAPRRRRGVVGVVEPALRQDHPPRAVRVPSHHASRPGMRGQVRWEVTRAGRRAARRWPPTPAPAGCRVRPRTPSGTSRCACASSRQPCASPNHSMSSRACSASTAATSPRAGGGGHRLDRRTRATGPGTATGRPRQPRPTTTPSHPVSAIIRGPSAPSNTSPLPSTGIDRTCSLSAAIGRPVGRARRSAARRSGRGARPRPRPRPRRCARW